METITFLFFGDRTQHAHLSHALPLGPITIYGEPTTMQLFHSDEKIVVNSKNRLNRPKFWKRTTYQPPPQLLIKGLSLCLFRIAVPRAPLKKRAGEDEERRRGMVQYGERGVARTNSYLGANTDKKK